ncbi:MAG TPA: dienelactone hydrolase family protein, partial [Actinomycetota bacterium]|nr:dienelactone hydrolase family protein [Actinomycetota bacterium]
MSEIILFHHAQGLTDGVRAFADELRAAGHTVHTPDVYDGKTFDTLEDGIAYAKEIGFGTALERGVAAAEGLSAEMVYAGFSLGAMPAVKLAITRPGVKGVILMHSVAPPSEPQTWVAQAYLITFGTVGVFGLYLFLLSRWTASAVSYEFVLAPLA